MLIAKMLLKEKTNQNLLLPDRTCWNILSVVIMLWQENVLL